MSAELEVPAEAGATDRLARSDGRRWLSGVDQWDLVEVAIAVAAFVVLSVVILRTATFLPEPDDYAYKGTILAMTHGHFLTLSTAQVSATGAELGGGHWQALGQLPTPIAQWVRLPSGRWISEKDPGFPFLAFGFQWLGLIRLDQLFYAAIGCVGLFAGARRWLGRFGGATAAGLYCTCGAALLWGWRDYMPTLTDASLIAAGAGALLWVVLAVDASPRRRIMVGLAAFLALEAATFTRYTDIVVLGCAVVAAAVAWRLPATRLPRRALAWWLGSVLVFGFGLGGFDTAAYGGPLRSGYRPGEIQFAFGALKQNLRYMPAHLLQAMPVFVLGVIALAWIALRWLRLARTDGAGVRPAGGAGARLAGGAGVRPADGAEVRPAGGAGERLAGARRDLGVAAALLAAWLAIWALYLTYTWTAEPFGTTLQFARFYVPALGPIVLLAAWLITRVPARATQPAITALVTAVALVGMSVLGVQSFHQMIAARPAIPTARACRPVPVPPGGPAPAGPPRCRPSRPGASGGP
jgi:hypothetical protein